MKNDIINLNYYYNNKLHNIYTKTNINVLRLKIFSHHNLAMYYNVFGKYDY